jgi:hypothetical protein
MPSSLFTFPAVPLDFAKSDGITRRRRAGQPGKAWRRKPIRWRRLGMQECMGTRSRIARKIIILTPNAVERVSSAGMIFVISSKTSQQIQAAAIEKLLNGQEYIEEDVAGTADAVCNEIIFL